MQDLIQQRLHNQLLSSNQRTDPASTVRHMLCMQAQDLAQNKWAIASRAWCNEQDIIEAFTKGEIVRTRTQRGTIHTVCAEDAGWMTALCASKTLWWFKKRREYLGIQDTEIDDILDTLPQILADGPMSRSAIAQVLTSKWFDCSANKPYHIMCYAGTLWMTVQWPIIGKEHSFVLSSQRIKSPKLLSEDEALATLCLRYFSSHGPATITDLQWRSGLWVAMIKKWIALCGDSIQASNSNEKVYYASSTSHYTSSEATESSIHFLAWFDEFLLGYKDRTATLDLDHHVLVDKARNGVFKPTVMMGGKTVGIWSIHHKTKNSALEVRLFDEYKIEKEILESALKLYQKFIKKTIHIVL